MTDYAKYAAARIARAETADSIITMVTEATTPRDALAVLKGIPSATLLAVADQLYVEADGHGAAWLRRGIVEAARA